jgi:hypothetical protein
VCIIEPRQKNGRHKFSLQESKPNQQQMAHLADGWKVGKTPAGQAVLVRVRNVDPRAVALPPLRPGGKRLVASKHIMTTGYVTIRPERAYTGAVLLQEPLMAQPVNVPEKHVMIKLPPGCSVPWLVAEDRADALSLVPAVRPTPKPEPTLTPSLVAAVEEVVQPAQPEAAPAPVPEAVQAVQAVQVEEQPVVSVEVEPVKEATVAPVAVVEVAPVAAAEVVNVAFQQPLVAKKATARKPRKQRDAGF